MLWTFLHFHKCLIFCKCLGMFRQFYCQLLLIPSNGFLCLFDKETKPFTSKQQYCEWISVDIGLEFFSDASHLWYFKEEKYCNRPLPLTCNILRYYGILTTAFISLSPVSPSLLLLYISLQYHTLKGYLLA
jgi:hypothetical protein